MQAEKDQRAAEQDLNRKKKEAAKEATKRAEQACVPTRATPFTSILPAFTLHLPPSADNTASPTPCVWNNAPRGRQVAKKHAEDQKTVQRAREAMERQREAAMKQLAQERAQAEAAEKVEAEARNKAQEVPTRNNAVLTRNNAVLTRNSADGILTLF